MSDPVTERRFALALALRREIRLYTMAHGQNETTLLDILIALCLVQAELGTKS